MDCEKIRGLLELYVAGDLQPADKDQVERHVSVCTQCIDSLAQSKEWFKSFEKLYSHNDPGAGVDKLIIREIKRREKGMPISEECPNHPQQQKVTGSTRKLRILIPIASAAVVILAVSIFVLLKAKSADQIRLIDGKVIITENLIRTSHNEQGAVQLPDESVIQVRENTELRIESIKKEAEKVLHLSHGSASFEVTSQAKTFTVKTSVGDVEVLGTKFSMNLQNSGGNDMKNLAVLFLLVTVHEGSVQVKNDLGYEKLTVGERAIVYQDKTPEKVKEVTQDPAQLCCEKHKSQEEKLKDLKDVYIYRCDKCCKLCEVMRKNPEICKEHSHEKLSGFLCLNCAKKDGVCPVCGDKVGQAKLEWADEKEAICVVCDKKYQAEAKKHGREVIHYNFDCKKCGHQSPRTCVRCFDEKGYHLSDWTKLCADCAKKESVCRACLKKVGGGQDKEIQERIKKLIEDLASDLSSVGELGAKLRDEKLWQKMKEEIKQIGPSVLEMLEKTLGELKSKGCKHNTRMWCGKGCEANFRCGKVKILIDEIQAELKKPKISEEDKKWIKAGVCNDGHEAEDILRSHICIRCDKRFSGNAAPIKLCSDCASKLGGICPVCQRQKE